MKKIFVIGLIATLSVHAQLINDYENQKVVGVNKEKYHVNVVPHGDLLNALAYDFTLSPFYKSLNGNWKFNWVAKPADAPKDFYKPEYNVSNRAEIKVPGNIELQGYGTPIFRNIVHPFTPANPPYIPANDNPVGSYRTTFNLPSNWGERQVFVNFDGVESAFYLWINGQKVGYSENSYSPAEFNITKYLKEGENTIAVQVYRFSDGSYLEDQDFWRLSGIFRNVYLYSKSAASLSDYTVVTDFDENFENANLSLKMKLKSFVPKDKFGYSAEIALYDASKKLVFSSKTPDVLPVNTGAEIRFNKEVKSPKKWNTETPYLYTLIITLKNNKGGTQEILSTRVGFKEVNIKNGVLQVNGQRVIVRGVNRHEHDMITGRYVNRESMLKDIKLMKQFNINAVRTSHYPNTPEWYDLCDEYGIYLCDEANHESHFFWDKFSKDTSWIIPFMDRIQSLVERDKNHSSVLYWSLGNESGFGPNHVKTSDWVRANEPTRPVHYNPADRDPSIDIIGPMYPSVESFIANARDDKRPVIMCEYAHAMGNSAGNLKDYWIPVYTMPRAQGGYIWDWVDQGFLKNGKDGKPFIANGGEMNDTTSEKFTAFDGLVNADRVVQPELFEYKYIIQPIRTTALDLANGKVNIKNWYEATNVSKFLATWELKEGGKTIQTGTLTGLDIAPNQEKEVIIPFKKPEIRPGQEYFINLSFKTTEDFNWAKAGHEVSYDQFKLPFETIAPMLTYAENDKNFKFQESAQELSVLGTNFSLVFSKSTGNLISYLFKSKELIKNGPELSLWRAPTENDDTQISATGQSAYNWKRYGLDALQSPLNSLKISSLKKGVIEVSVKQDISSAALEKFAFNTFTYTIYASGDVFVSHQFDLRKSLLFTEVYGFARVGMLLTLPKGYETFAWYGKGPWESYLDRKEAATVGIYKSTVDEQYFPYSKPQACGNNSDVRWAVLANNEGVGLAAFGQPNFETSALHYNDKDLYVKSSESIKKSEEIFWHIDIAQSGLGGASCGPGVRTEYITPVKSYTYSVRLKPVDLNIDNLSEMAVVAPRVAAPELQPEKVELANTGKFLLKSATNDAQIRFTLDGTEPTTASGLYVKPFKIKSSDIKAKAFKTGFLASETATFGQEYLNEKYAKDTMRYREKNIVGFIPTEEDLFKSNVKEVLLANTDTVRYNEPAKKVEIDITGYTQLRLKIVDIDKSKHWDHFVMGEGYFTKKDGSIVYLSDLNIPFNEFLKRDESIDRNPLFVAKKMYKKGLGIHTPAELWCNFKTDEFVKFTAFFGTDDEMNGYGSGKASLVVMGVK